MTISAISNGVSGMRHASERLNTSAARIAGMAPDVDIGSELVEGIEAGFQFRASARVVEAVSDMEKSAIDILA